MARLLLLVPIYLLAVSLPLLSAVGANLEYEYALISAYLSLALIPAAALWLPDRYLPRPDGERRIRVPVETFWIFLISPLFGLAAALAVFLSGYCPCSQTGFGFWMAVLWYPAWILGHAAYHLILRGRVAGFSKKRLAFGFTVIALGLIVETAVPLWLNPQKRISSLIGGFLHGPIYDEWIAIDTGIILKRSAHLCIAAALLFAAFFRRQTGVFCAVIVFGAGFVVTTFLSGNFYSTANKQASLDELMYSKLESPDFTLHFRPQPKAEGEPAPAKNAPPPLAIQRLFRDAEFHVSELKTILKEDHLPHVHIYVYPSDDKKKLWFGGGSTDVTDVVTPSVHVSLGSWPHPTLRHELVHALSSGFAFHGIGFHPNMAFTEGLAVALAPSSSTLSLDDGAASLIATDRLPDVDALFSPMFWKVSGSRAYTVAGSLIRFLIETKGIEGVKALYAGESWDKAFNERQDDTLQHWKDKIQKGYDKDKNALFAEALFRYPGVLDDQCPHSKADLQRSRAEGVFVRTRQPIGWDPDGDYLTWVLALDPHDKEMRLRLWRREIRKVANDRFAAEGRLRTWREALRRARAVPSEVLEDVEMGILEADLARLLGDEKGSAKILEDLAAEGSKKFFGESLRREIEARTTIEKVTGGSVALEWRKFLAGWRKSLPDGAGEGSPWLLNYLAVRNERDSNKAADLAALVALPVDGQMSATFHFEWYKTIAYRLMRGGDFATAKVAFEKAATVTQTANKDLFVEHARRAKYYGEREPFKEEARQASTK